MLDDLPRVEILALLYTKILVPTDGSSYGDRAINDAVRLACAPTQFFRTGPGIREDFSPPGVWARSLLTIQLEVPS